MENMRMEFQKRASSSYPVRILVVDDHPNTATMLARAIAQMGPQVSVLSASSGPEALDRIKDTGVDVLITDMIMPGMNGLELVQKLQTHPGGRPAHVILITAFDVPGLKVTARRLKVDEIISKPVRPERICQSVENILDQWSQSAPAQQVEKDHRKAFRILIADDNPDNVTLLARYLQNEGYDHISAFDGMETLQKTRVELPDLVLLDINMPKMDGFTALQEIRSDPAIQHIPVIILTAARLDPIDVQSGLTLGADDYVIKPFDRRELMARIRTKLRVKQAEDVIRRRNQELNLLPEIGKELSARFDLDELASILTQRTVETLGAALGYLLVLNANHPFQKTYHPANTPPLPMPDKELPLPQELMDELNSTRQGLIIEDNAGARWSALPQDQYRSAVAVPLLGRHELLGMLILAHEQEKFFNLDNQLLLQAIASQAAIAIENARLYAHVEQERERLDVILQSSADAILLLGADGRISLMNTACEGLFNSQRIGIGMRLENGHGYDELIDLLKKGVHSQIPLSTELTWNDQRSFVVLITPVEGGSQMVVLHDVTHFKNLEKMKNEFIAATSHDLKNPIQAIAGFSELMEKAGPLNKQQKEFVQRIQSSAERMTDLAQNMMKLIQTDLERNP
jgi:CheY-like chemotaxis protein